MTLIYTLFLQTNTNILLLQGFADVTRYLLSAGAQAGLSGDDGMTALHFATQNGHLGNVITPGHIGKLYIQFVS